MKLQLIELYNSSEVTSISRFCQTASDLNPKLLEDAYQEVLDNAPNRANRGKTYFGSRSGITSSGSRTNRREEHLAVALYNASKEGRELRVSKEKLLSIIDYQTPLKARYDDKGIGKIDLLGVLEPSELAVIELKVAKPDGGPSDTPLRALLEGLTYCALVEANLATIAQEVKTNLGIDITIGRPTLIVMAPQDYWLAYLNHKSSGEWPAALMQVVDWLDKHLGLTTYILSLQGVEFNLGLGVASNDRLVTKADARMRL